MSLSLVQSKILQPFVDETLQNLKTMANMGGHADDGFVDAVDQFRFKGYAICSETTGGIDGVILMHHYIETAVAMGNAVRQNLLEEDTEYDEINDAMADALAEWGNTVLGRAAKSLGGYNLGIEFEPPYFIFDTDTMASLLTGVKDIISVPVHVEGVGRFYFNYLIRNIQEGVATNLNANLGNTSIEGDGVAVDYSSGMSLAPDKKILVVDDMKIVRSSMKKFLASLGYENVVEAIDGKDAVTKVEQEQPDFIFMDIVMPQMNGNEVLQRLRDEENDVPVVMLTSVADQNIIDECEYLGIEGYIIKPLTRETGPAAIGRFLIGES